MDAAFFLVIIAFAKGSYHVDHYPMQQSPWIERIAVASEQKGKLSIEFKDGMFSSVPKCRWNSLNSDSNAVGRITYHSKSKISLAFFEKDRSSKDSPKDLSFILSCKE